MLRHSCSLWDFRVRVLPSLTAWIALVVLAPAMPADAQIISGDLVVRVVDNSDLIVPGAAMVLTDVDTGVTHEAVSDGQGTYLFGQLKPGLYKLRLTAVNGDQSVRKSAALRVTKKR